MILTGKDTFSKEITVQCNCGCESLVLTQFTWDEDNSVEYFLSLLVRAWDVKDESLWWKFKRKARFIWDIIVKGEHQYTELCLKENDITELRKALAELEGE